MTWSLEPDYATPPGETLAETLIFLGMTQTELAKRMGRPVKTINEIIQAKSAVTADTAVELERVLGVPASLWSAMEANFREQQARVRASEKLAIDEGWLSELPLKEMEKRGWLARQKDIRATMDAILRFFGVAGIEEWKTVWEDPLVQYRKSRSFCSSTASLAAWIRQGELEGRRQSCEKFDAAKFRKMLTEIKALTLQEPNEWVPALRSACNVCGVAYVFIAEFPNCHVSGATRWLRDDCALILQSGRHKDDGHFWFTFFHEARHVLQGGQKRAWIIETDEQSKDPLERDADEFAAEHLVPSRRIAQLRRENNGRMPVEAVKKLAEELGIAAGIVAGHLQHEGYWKPVVAHKLKRRFSIDPVNGIVS